MTAPTIEGHPSKRAQRTASGETIIGTNAFAISLPASATSLAAHGATRKCCPEAKHVTRMMQRAEEFNATVGNRSDYETVGQAARCLWVTPGNGGEN